MDRDFERRKKALIKECEVSPAVFQHCLERLESFTKPFASLLVRREQKQHAADFISGLLSDLQRKNTESIAYRHDQDRKDLQNFIGQSNWDYKPLIMELCRQVGEQLGRPDGVLVFDPSGFPKKGQESVGTKRQWCGVLGKRENCQVAVFMGYVSGEEHALVNMRLYLPEEWARDRTRRKKCHVPRDVRFKTRHELCLDMLRETGHLFPHSWITGDEELGRNSRFRRDLRDLNERYLFTVPCNIGIRDLEIEPPVSSAPNKKQPFQHIAQWSASLPEDAWTRIDVRDGERGPLEVDIVKRRVQARMEKKRIGPEEMLVVIRRRDENNKLIHDYYLSNASPETELNEFARAAKAEHRIEECIQRGKSETGLGDYEVRGWPGWHHHITLSLLAAWFLNTESRRGKKMDTSDYLSADPGEDRNLATCSLPMRWSRANAARNESTAQAHPAGAVLSL